MAALRDTHSLNASAPPARSMSEIMLPIKPQTMKGPGHLLVHQHPGQRVVDRLEEAGRFTIMKPMSAGKGERFEDGVGPQRCR